MPQRLRTPLTQILADRGIRHDWFARQLGVQPWTFSRIEAGVQPRPADWYARCAAILGVPVTELVDQEIAA